MSDAKISEKLTELLSALLADIELELDDLKVVPAGKRRTVQVRVDGDGSSGHGPDLDEIAEATRLISQALDDADAMGDAPYTLEVSSRGVSAPLTKPAHFRRNVGRLVRLTRRDGEPILGRIKAADEDRVTLQPEPEPGSKPTKKQLAAEPVTITFDQVTKAVVQIEMNRKDDDLDFADDDVALDQIDDELTADFNDEQEQE